MRDDDPDAPRLRAVYVTTGPDAMRVAVHRTGAYPVSFTTALHPGREAVARLDRPGSYHRALAALELLAHAVDWRVIPAADVAERSGMSVASAERALTMLEADRVVLAKGRGYGKRRRLNRNVYSTTTAQAWHEAGPDPEVIDGRGRGKPSLGVREASGGGRAAGLG